MTQSKAPSCCPPQRVGAPLQPAVPLRSGGGRVLRGRENAVLIKGGTALVGTARPQIPDDGENPLRKVTVKSFRIGATTVTNAEFARFIEDTGYVTEAERFGWSFVFWSQVPKEYGHTQGVLHAQWWRRVDGATWCAPQGPGTEAACLPDHPVVHMSWNDASTYADWAGGRLPTEAEWEHAARAGQGDVMFPWGDWLPDDTGFFPCNIWQGRFPEKNSAADGYLATAPARSFAPNENGLYNLVGNVWEWTSDSFKIRSLKKPVKERLAGMKGYKTAKGGSFLCHQSYCFRYRIAARIGNSPDSTTTHQGVRVVWPD